MFTTTVLAPTVSHSWPPPPQDPLLRPKGRSSPYSYGVTALPWVPVHVKPRVHPPRVESLVPPQSCGAPTVKPDWFSKPNALEALSPDSRPPGWGAWCGAQNSLLMGESLWYVYFLVCGSPSHQIWELIIKQKHSYHLTVTSLSLGVEYLFWWLWVLFCQWLFSNQL